MRKMRKKKSKSRTIHGSMRKPRKKIKALGMFSGGLDSMVAAKLMQEMGFEVELVYFSSPFFNCVKTEGSNPSESVRKSAERLGLKLAVLDKGKDYLEVIKNAKHGYGTGMNPCIDCRIYTFKKAWRYAKRIGAKFIFTGEVLGERPMSQTKKALELIDRKSKLDGKIVRPLSGRLLPSTEAEIKRWLKRGKLLSISGRGRQVQMQLAKKWNLSYPSPAGGCLLTEKHYGLRLADVLEHSKDMEITSGDIALLSLGRHFRFKDSKIIVGRNEKENIQLKRLKNASDLVLECGEGVMGPITVLQGDKGPKMVSLAAALTAYFSDANKEGTRRRKVKVDCWEGTDKDPSKAIQVSPDLDMKKEVKKGLVWIGQNGPRNDGKNG